MKCKSAVILSFCLMATGMTVNAGRHACSPKESLSSQGCYLTTDTKSQGSESAILHKTSASDHSSITGDQLLDMVSGNWTTASSSGDRKQFVSYYVLESSHPDPDSDAYSLKRVSLIESINDTPDGKGYDYALNTGNHYYLYPENPTIMECHWEPDGYSGADSLVKEEEGTESSETNSNSYYDMSTYTGSEETFQGTISSFTGYGATGNSDECLALNLKNPIRVVTSDGLNTLIYSIQLNTDYTLSEYVDQNINVGVKGSLFEAFTDHHYMPILMDVDRVK